MKTLNKNSPRKIREKDLVDELKNQLSNQYRNIFSHVNLANKNDFSQILQQSCLEIWRQTDHMTLN